MKIIIISLLFVLIYSKSTYSQSPKSFNYQIVLTDASNNPIRNQVVDFKVSIVRENSLGTKSNVYSEYFTEQVTTELGQLNLIVGNGTSMMGSIADIDWSDGIYYLHTEVSLDGGTGFTELGEIAFESVPYSLYAENAKNGVNSVLFDNASNVLSINEKTVDLSSLLQTLTYNEATKMLRLSRGGTVDLSGLSGSEHWSKTGASIFNTNTGNVGIGTNTPNQKLHVNGNIAVNGDVLCGLNNVYCDHLIVGDDEYLRGDRTTIFPANHEITTNSHFSPEFSDSLNLGDSNNRWKNLHLSGSINLGDFSNLNATGLNIIETNSHLQPITDDKNFLGISTKRWKNLYLSGELHLGNTEVLKAGGADLIVSNSNFVPDTNNTLDLGSNARKWRDVYCSRNTFNGSDFRLKRNITPLEYGIDEILKIKTYSYYWKDKNMDDGNRYIGVIAQELKEVIPELVRESDDEEKLMSVNYIGLIPVLIKAIKEQQSEIDSLRSMQTNNSLTANEIKTLREFLQSNSTVSIK